MNKKTLFVYAPAIGHTYPHHPENDQRGRAIYHLLEREKLLADLLLIEPVPATDEQLHRAHAPRLVERVRAVSQQGGGRLDADTYATAVSYESARLAAGGACAAVDAILTGQADNGFVVGRPPGHHAEHGRVGGFCLFNHIAIAARQAQQGHSLERVAIIDFDVHHGNGTEEIFYEDGQLLFVSLHQYGRRFYPGTGALTNIGQGAGHGYTLNVPLPTQVGDQGYATLWETVIEPRLRRFRPQLLLVSAGYDAHWADPLANGVLGLTGFAHLSRQLVALAEALCHGRLLFVLEGGYLLDALAYGVLNSLYALLGHDIVQDPLGEYQGQERDITPLQKRLRETHLKR